MAAATGQLENLGVEDGGGEDLVPSRTRAKKKGHARGVAVLGGLGVLELAGGEKKREEEEEEEEEL